MTHNKIKKIYGSAWVLCAGFSVGVAVPAHALNIIPKVKPPRDLIGGELVEVGWPTFDPDGLKLSAIAEAAASIWEDVLEDDKDHPMQIRYYSGLGSTKLGQTSLFGNIDINPGFNYFFDSTPLIHSEFNLTTTLFRDLTTDQQDDWFNGTPSGLLEVGIGISGFDSNGDPLPNAIDAVAQNKTDMLTLMLHEMGHSLGITNLFLDYYIKSEHLGGANVQLVVSRSNPTHVEDDFALIRPGLPDGLRVLPSAIEILAASLNQVSPLGDDVPKVNLPRKEFIRDGQWHEPTNWIGGKVPDAGDDDVRVRHGGTAIIGARPDGLSDHVGNVRVDEGSVIEFSSGSFISLGNLTLADGHMSVLDGGQAFLGTLTLDAAGSPTVVMDGGSLHVGNELIIPVGSQFGGHGFVGVVNGPPAGAGSALTNNGFLYAQDGTLTIRETQEQGETDLDTINLAGPDRNNNVYQVVAGWQTPGQLVINATVEPFEGRMLIRHDSSVTFNQGWTLAPGGVVDFDTGSNQRLDGSFSVLQGRVNVNGVSRITGETQFDDTAQVMVRAAGELNLDGPILYRGGSYTGAGAIVQNQTATVAQATTINVARYDLDGDNQSITAIRAPLTIDVDSIETTGELVPNRFDGTINTRGATAVLDLHGFGPVGHEWDHELGYDAIDRSSVRFGVPGARSEQFFDNIQRSGFSRIGRDHFRHTQCDRCVACPAD